MRALTALALAAALSVGLGAQSTRRLVTIDGLRQFSGFFHLQSVTLRGTLVSADQRTSLRTESHEIRVLLDPGVKGSEGPVEVRGSFIDIGKLEPNDGRLNGYDRPQDAPWPRPGEELLLRVSSLSPVPTTASASLRALALEPWRFEGQTVTVVGQFRGRNLFGDLPGAPRKSPHDFVVKSGDAALWVAGLRPKGKGFDLDISSRLDTTQWLEITGVVKQEAGLVRIDATKLATTGQASPAGTERDDTAVLLPSPPVEVVFSTPVVGETDVAPSHVIRIQFSRNIKPESLKDRVHITYAPSDSAESLPEWQTGYDASTRALAITFTKPLEPYRTVRVELREGILGFDDVPLVPWQMTFTVGG